MFLVLFNIIVFVCIQSSSALVSPIVECTAEMNGDCYARFGYVNTGPSLVFIPPGTNNQFSFFALLTDLPVRFEPGRHERVFQASWQCSFGPVMWILNDGNGEKHATAVHVPTCVCGSRCLAGTRFTSVFDAHNKISYYSSGGECKVNHVVADIPNCDLVRRDSARGPCRSNYSSPRKYEGSQFDIAWNNDPNTFALQQVTVKGADECALCEFIVPVCFLTTSSSSTSSSISSVTTSSTTSSSSTSSSISYVTTSSTTSTSSQSISKSFLDSSSSSTVSSSALIVNNSIEENAGITDASITTTSTRPRYLAEPIVATDLQQPLDPFRALETFDEANWLVLIIGITVASFVMMIYFYVLLLSFTGRSRFHRKRR